MVAKLDMKEMVLIVKVSFSFDFDFLFFFLFSFFSFSFSQIISYLILDIDECLINNGECDEHAECINIIGSRECNCLNGYQKDSENCIGMIQISDFFFFSFS